MRQLDSRSAEKLSLSTAHTLVRKNTMTVNNKENEMNDDLGFPIPDDVAHAEACVLASRLVRGDYNHGGRMILMKELARLVDHHNVEPRLVGLAVGRALRTMRRWLHVGRLVREIEEIATTSVTGWEDLPLDTFTSQAPNVIAALRLQLTMAILDDDNSFMVELEWEDVVSTYCPAA